MIDKQLPPELRAKTFDDLIERWDWIETKRKGYEKILDIISDPKGKFNLPLAKLESYRSKWQDDLSLDVAALIVTSCDYFGIANSAGTDKILSLKLFEEINKRTKKRPQGREQKWGFFEKLGLVTDVEKHYENGLTVEQACKQLVKDKRWSVTSTGDGMQAP